MQDTHPEYECNPDTLSAMRAKDLHCGRGSSPLRTKFKKPKSNKSLNKSNHKVEYYYDNGVININTPIEEVTTFEREEEEDTPKTRTINQLKSDNNSFKSFNRRSKILSESSQDKGKITMFIYIEALHQKSPGAVRHEQRISKFTGSQKSKSKVSKR